MEQLSVGHLRAICAHRRGARARCLTVQAGAAAAIQDAVKDRPYEQWVAVRTWVIIRAYRQAPVPSPTHSARCLTLRMGPLRDDLAEVISRDSRISARAVHGAAAPPRCRTYWTHISSDTCTSAAQCTVNRAAPFSCRRAQDSVDAERASEVGRCK